jgi:single-strand selective monofunctional uracil DNA glycosylase
MSQTGVPFGSVSIVREWMGIHEKVNRPEREHPKRRILGFDCRREEVSGQRLWGWARDNFREPSRFFERFFVANYCPLAFLESSGRNRTPNQLPAGERKLLFERCDPALREIVDFLAVRVVIGVGRFAEERAQSALAGLGLRIEGIPHPSPANPAAGRNWGEKVSEKLNSWGIELGRISTHVRR